MPLYLVRGSRQGRLCFTLFISFLPMPLYMNGSCLDAGGLHSILVLLLPAHATVSGSCLGGLHSILVLLLWGAFTAS